MRRNLLILRAAGVVLALALFLSSIQFTGAASTDSQLVLKCAIKSFGSSNPFTQDANSLRVLGLIYDSATKVHPVTGKLIPYIAVGSASLSNDTRSVTWKDCAVGSFGYCPESTWEDPFRPEIIIFYDFEHVFWQDGVQMDIRDVMFTFHAQAATQTSWLGHPLVDMAGGPGSNYSDSKWLHIQNVWESEDGSRAALRFVLQSDMYSVFEHYLSSIILPYHIWGSRVSGQETDNAKIWCDPEFNVSDEYSWKRFIALQWDNPWPVGSGLFSWAGRSGDRITLAPWRGHFYKPGFKYYLPDAGIAPVPRMGSLSLTVYRNQELAVRDLENGKLDLIAWPQTQSVISAFEGNLDVDRVSLKSTSMVYVGYNMARESFGYIKGYDGMGPLGSDYGRPLRKALAHCIDTRTMSAFSNPNTRNMAPLAPLKAWENSSVPTYTFDPGEAINILEKAGYVLDDPESQPGNGNWWSNADGTSIGSGAGGAVRLLVTEPGYDSLRYQAASMIAGQMRKIGIKTELVAVDLGTLTRRLGTGDFDMFIFDKEFSEFYKTRPEVYYYGSFHSYTISEGQNYFGYSNSSFDTILAHALDTADLDTERRLVQEAAASIAYDLPIYPLYYVSNVEIYRAASIDGLVDDGSGSLLNPRSMASAFRQEKPALRARFMNTAMTYLSNMSKTVTVLVMDQIGRPVPGVDVTLETSSGVLLNLTGQTDEYGQFSTNFTAPYVPLVETYNNWEAIEITMTEAVLKGYRNAPAVSMLVTVFPEDKRIMYVDASAAQDVITDRDVDGNAGFTTIRIDVTDIRNMPVNDVNLRIRSGDANVTLSASTIATDSGGTAIITLFAPDVDAARECVITINATKGGLIDASQNIVIVIQPLPPTLIEAHGSSAGDIIIPLAVVIIVFAIAGIAYRARRKARGKK